MSTQTKARRARGELHKVVKSITDQFVTDPNFFPQPHTLLTPHRIAVAIEERTGEKVSNAAIQRVLERWEEIGYCLLTEDPVSFFDYTTEAASEGYRALHEDYQRRCRAARKAVGDEARVKARALVASRMGVPVMTTGSSNTTTGGVTLQPGQSFEPFEDDETDETDEPELDDWVDDLDPFELGELREAGVDLDEVTDFEGYRDRLREL